MNSNNIVPFLQIVMPIFLLLIGGIGWLYKHEREKRLSIEKQLSESKHKTYSTILSIFYETLKGVKNMKNVEPSVLQEQMLDASKDLILYGSDEAIRKFIQWQKASQTLDINLNPLADLIVAIRKDMNKNSNIDSETFLQYLILDYDEFKKISKN